MYQLLGDGPQQLKTAQRGFRKPFYLVAGMLLLLASAVWFWGRRDEGNTKSRAACYSEW